MLESAANNGTATVSARGAISTALPTRCASSTLRSVLSVLGGCLAMAIAAQVCIPLPWTPVPMTLQSFVMLVIAFSLSPVLAGSTMMLYVACGTAGLPMFSAGSAGLSGVTAGYIVGFIVAAGLVSVLKGSGSAGGMRLGIAGAAGLLTLFVLGVGWQVVCVGHAWGAAVALGFTPFAVKAAVELGLAVALVTTLRGWRRGS